MNQVDETVVAPNPTIPNPTPPSEPNQANETTPAVTSASTQVPTAPMTFSANFPDIHASNPSGNLNVATQPTLDSLSPSQPSALPTSIPTTPVSVNLASVDVGGDSVKTIPMPSQSNTDKLPLVEAQPLEVPQASALPPLPPLNSPTLNVIPDISIEPAPSMPADSTIKEIPENVTPTIEPLQVSATSPSMVSQPAATVSLPNLPPPPIGERPNVPSSSGQYTEPVVIEAKPSVNPEPLPAPLTPPTIKTSPSPVLSNPASYQSAAPVNVTMSSPAIEPLNKPGGQAAPVLVKGAGKYQIRVINEKCIGAASCVAVAPKAFKLNEQQIAEVLTSASEESDENLLLSAQSCPTMAIEIIDSETGKKVWPR